MLEPLTRFDGIVLTFVLYFVVIIGEMKNDD